MTNFLDRNKDGRITKEDFNIIANKSGKKGFMPQIATKMLFKALDKNGDGEIDKNELGGLFKGLSGKKSKHSEENYNAGQNYNQNLNNQGAHSNNQAPYNNNPAPYNNNPAPYNNNPAPYNNNPAPYNNNQGGYRAPDNQFNQAFNHNYNQIPQYPAPNHQYNQMPNNLAGGPGYPGAHPGYPDDRSNGMPMPGGMPLPEYGNMNNNAYPPSNQAYPQSGSQRFNGYDQGW